jgi:competence ComEA-like helix-hairpin-helix protein
MAKEKIRPGFALTEIERRTLIVLGLLLIIGLVSKQFGRWNEPDQTVIIQGAPPVVSTEMQELDSDTLRGMDVSGSLAPSTSQDVPSVLRVSSSSTDRSGNTGQEDENRSPDDSMRLGEITSTLNAGQVRTRVSDLLSETDFAPTGSKDAEGRFDLNDATSENLESIPGIGSVLAKRVLDWRIQHGSFQRVEDLLLIEGIGDKRLATMKQFVYVQPQN